jgi:membrane-bound metal-dependent hydrolase YbcI (DUF457 family)
MFYPTKITSDRIMPFTPFHMGPGLLIKAVLKGSFSLMVFGWTQVVMDLQPLIVLITGEGHLHGFSHTYLGASLIAAFCALSGLYLTRTAFSHAFPAGQINLSWPVAIISAFIGSFSHVLLDSLMHADVQPFYPLSLSNSFLHAISVEALHKICMYSGLVGGACLFYLHWRTQRK